MEYFFPLKICLDATDLYSTFILLNFNLQTTSWNHAFKFSEFSEVGPGFSAHHVCEHIYW